MKRLYIHDALVAFVRKIPVGPGSGPRIDPWSRLEQDAVPQAVVDATSSGQVLLGGKPSTGLKNGDPLVDEEQFGPANHPLCDIDGAITAANGSANGLGGAIWTSDVKAARRLALRMECGSVWIKAHHKVSFGGVKQSGLGVEVGEKGLAE